MPPPVPTSPCRTLLRRLVALGLTLALAACSAADGGTSPAPADPDGARAAAAALAAGLARGDVRALPFAGTTGPAVDALRRPLVAGMGEVQPTVSVRSVDTSGATATATLAFSWAFPGVAQPWTYDSRAELVSEGGQWRTSWRPDLVQPGLDGSNRLVARRTAAARGRILGQGGDVIVRPRAVLRIGIDKTAVTADEQRASATKLAKLVDVDASAFASRVAKAGARAFVEAIVLRADAADRPSASALGKITGAVALRSQAVLAPTRDFARPVLGSLRTATTEDVKKAPTVLAAGDLVGASGLQKRYDAQLRGTPAVSVRLVATSASGSASPTPTPAPTPAATPSGAPAPAALFSSAAVPGRDLTTTIDVRLQRLAEKTLADTDSASAVVAIRPSTGRVLAVANGADNGGQSLATVGRYPPGSTFKVVSSLALLRAGLTPDSRVTCPPTVTVDGKRFKNYSDYPDNHLGTIDLRTALAQSCNTAFIGQRGELSGSGLSEAAASLGLGTDYDVGYSSFFGSVPTSGTATGRAAAMIGQGTVLASPLAMAAVVASVSAGRTVVPQLVTSSTPAPTAKPLTAAETDALRSMMGSVVSAGSGRVLRPVEPPNVIAKTGTAEFGTTDPPRTHAWMIAAQGDLAVAVFVDRGSSGSRTAGPLLARFLTGGEVKTVSEVSAVSEVVTGGEAMGLLLATGDVPLHAAEHFDALVAGAESNVALGLARLGHRVSYFGRVGADVFGDRIRRVLRGEGVDVSALRVDPELPTGLLFRDTARGAPVTVVYRRAGSAGAALTPADLPREAIQQAKVLHVTGITAALSPSSYRATVEAMRLARAAGVAVCFDPNLRLRLAGPERWVEIIDALARQSDLVLAGEDEAAVFCGGDDPVQWLGARGVSTVVLKRADGASEQLTGGGAVVRQPARTVPLADPVGAGDAFAAGWLSGWLRGLAPSERLREACAVASLVVATRGDSTGLPDAGTRAQVLAEGADVAR